jgi:tyrosyl-tRNA synthetase
MSNINTDPKKIKELLSRGVEEVIVRKDLEEKLASGKQLRIKFGIDPTSPNIHIGRSVPILKMRDFQELGHQIILLIGNFTGTIGDTSDKESERPMLDPKVVEENMRTYAYQAGKLLDLSKCEIVYNADWLTKLGFAEIGFLADQFSVSDFISRENIKKRLEAGKRVSLRELMYPLMQGYDSVAVKADVEIGGSDQRFNILAGRTIQSAYGQEPQNVILGPLIEGTDGRKMSSSWGNTINLNAEPADMYGKVMSIHDDLIIKYFILVTRVDMDTIREYEKALKSGDNPKIYKMKLAREIVRMYHGETAADNAEQSFTTAFSKGGAPEDIREIEVSKGEKIFDAILKSLEISKTELRRLFNSGAVSIVGGDKIKDQNTQLITDITLRIGKKRFLKIKIK